jgi:nitric oxide reductase subunit B
VVIEWVHVTYDISRRLQLLHELNKPVLLTNLFPGGVLQLWDSVSHGYWHARRLTYLMSGTFHTLEWVRIFADSVFLTLGVAPILIAALRSLAKRDAPRAAEAAQV